MEKATYVHDIGRAWTRQPGGRYWPCHHGRKERFGQEAEENRKASAQPRPWLRIPPLPDRLRTGHVVRSMTG